MNSRARDLWYAAIAVYTVVVALRGCVEDPPYNNAPVQEICSDAACGTFVATSPYGGVTAYHITHGRDVFLGGLYGQVTESSDDKSPTFVTFPIHFAAWYPLGVPVTGTAKYVTLHGEFEIYLHNDYIFSGREPIQGDSGSGVIQDEHLVGVITGSVVGGGWFAAVTKQ